MSDADPYEFDDAPFVLGLLDSEASFEFETHLLVCDECRARVERLGAAGAMLSTIDSADLAQLVADPEPTPDTLLSGLLRAAGVARRRRRSMIAGLAGAVAACVAALVVALWSIGSAPSSSPQRMVALRPTPLSATAELTSAHGDTRIAVDCRYDAAVGYAPTPTTYLLSVVDTAGGRHDLGSWTVVPDTESRFSRQVALPRAAIARVQIETTTHHAVLGVDV